MALMSQLGVLKLHTTPRRQTARHGAHDGRAEELRDRNPVHLKACFHTALREIPGFLLGRQLQSSSRGQYVCPRVSQVGDEPGGGGQRQRGELVQLREGSEG